MVLTVSCAIGNPLTYYDGTTFGWTGRMLTSATKGGKSLTFAYDEGGVRYTKTAAGVETNYYYNGNVLLAEQTGSTAKSYFYSPQGAVEGFIYYVYSVSDSSATEYLLL